MLSLIEFGYLLCNIKHLLYGMCSRTSPFAICFQKSRRQCKLQDKSEEGNLSLWSQPQTSLSWDAYCSFWAVLFPSLKLCPFCSFVCLLEFAKYNHPDFVHSCTWFSLSSFFLLSWLLWNVLVSAGLAWSSCVKGTFQSPSIYFLDSLWMAGKPLWVA